MSTATRASSLIITWLTSRAARRGGQAVARVTVRGARKVVTSVPAPVGASAMFAGAGAMHFARPDFFEAIVPDWFPSAKFANYASGAAELAFGVLVLPRRTRRMALLGLAGLAVVVYPANIDAAVNDVEVRNEDGRFVRSVGTASGPLQVANWVRLPLQIPLVWWLLREARRAPRGA